MKVTVIISTLNRCEVLARTLQSLAVSRVSESVAWDILVVDNGSRDQTRNVVEDFCRRYSGRFQYVYEPRVGKSNALNLAVSMAIGDVLAFTDDDVMVEPDWLENLAAVFKDPTWGGASGRTLPESGFSRPRWLQIESRDALVPLAIFDHGLVAYELTESPFGNNMAYRREMFEKYGGFRVDLGPHGGTGPQKSEDSEFGCRLLAAGERLHYEPSAVLYHSVPANRVHKSYFLAWWFDKARADIRAFGPPSGARWSVAGVPLYLFRRIAVWGARWIVAIRPDRRFTFKSRLWWNMGTAKECRLLRRERDQHSNIQVALTERGESRRIEP